LASATALAEKPERVKALFGNTYYDEKGTF